MCMKHHLDSVATEVVILQLPEIFHVAFSQGRLDSDDECPAPDSRQDEKEHGTGAQCEDNNAEAGLQTGLEGLDRDGLDREV